jgi:hypothetical protein
MGLAHRQDASWLATSPGQRTGSVFEFPGSTLSGLTMGEDENSSAPVEFVQSAVCQ